MSRFWLIHALFWLMVAALAAGYLWVINHPKPYESPPKLKQAEVKLVEWAHKYHGTDVVIVTPKRIYFERDGQEITLRRRG